MIFKKIITLLISGKPMLMLLFGTMSLVGAIFSSNFNSASFPHTFLSLLIGSLEPRTISVLHATGAFFIAALIWFGTALFNDYYDVEIDRKINPHRALVRGDISPGEVKSYAAGAYLIASLLVLLEGDWISRILVIAFIFLGLEYSAPPLRLRRWGWAANAIIGAGVAGAALGGAAGQYGVSSEVVVVAVALGVLAAAASSVKDYKDIEGDREAGVRTAPVVYGYERSVDMNMKAVGLSYGISMMPFMTGYFAISVLPLIFFIAIVNLKFIYDLKIKRDLAAKRRIYACCLACYFAEVAGFVLAKFLQ